jgi:hypothetical protein
MNGFVRRVVINGFLRVSYLASDLLLNWKSCTIDPDLAK